MTWPSGALLAASIATVIVTGPSEPVMHPLAAMTTPVVSLTAVSGYQGHAFVYAQVTDQVGTFPAPPLPVSPYVSHWEPIALQVPTCPILWAVFVYDRATGRQINPSPPGVWPDFFTSTIFCPTSIRTPVAAPPLDIARARLDLDLSVRADPPQFMAGLPTAVVAQLSSAVRGDLGLYLSMAIQEWRVRTWIVDFGDGQTATLPGSGTALRISHVYQQAGAYVPQVTADIVGQAQAAAYGVDGRPELVERSFQVEVGNSTAAFAGAATSGYTAPVVRAGVAPVLANQGGAPAAQGLSQIQALRGDLTTVFLRALIERDGFRTVNHRPVAAGHSVVTAWRYAPDPADGVSYAEPTGWVAARTPLAFRWDRPDHVAGGGNAYLVHLVVAVTSRYDDGTILHFDYPVTFAVGVGYSAVDG
jgi:hypothetical protein